MRRASLRRSLEKGVPWRGQLHGKAECHLHEEGTHTWGQPGVGMSEWGEESKQAEVCQMKSGHLSGMSGKMGIGNI